MRAVSTIISREWSAYTVSPVAYVLAAVFLALSGFLFAVILSSTRLVTLRYVFDNMNFLLIFLAPLITMRLLAEERRNGTMELLLTLPFRDSEVVIGKFLASLLLFVVILLPTVWYVVLLRVVGGTAPDAGPLLSGYLGLLLQGSALLAVGVFTSSLTSNQVVAAVMAFAIALTFWLLGAAAPFAGPQLARLFTFLTLPTHFQDFTRGVIDLQSVVYHLSLTMGFLFMTYVSLQTRRWL